VSALREAGYLIEASRGTGYRLTGSPGLALAWEVRPLLKSPLWNRVDGSPETVSTNDDARALARSGAEEGTVVVAARQSGGKGRLGRSWMSPAGGAYVSVVLRPTAAPVDIAPLALVVAIGIARGLSDLGACVTLKWPNDLWLGEAKLAGVLLETATEGDAVSWVVAGFGINVLRPAHAFQGAAYLCDAVPGVTPAQAAAAALDGVASAYSHWLSAGFGGLTNEFESLSVLSGRNVTVSDSSGAPVAHGRVDGVDSDGRLVLGTAEGVVRISAGDVTLRR